MSGDRRDEGEEAPSAALLTMEGLPPLGSGDSGGMMQKRGDTAPYSRIVTTHLEGGIILQYSGDLKG